MPLLTELEQHSVIRSTKMSPLTGLESARGRRLERVGFSLDAGHPAFFGITAFNLSMLAEKYQFRASCRT